MTQKGTSVSSLTEWVTISPPSYHCNVITGTNPPCCCLTRHPLLLLVWGCSWQLLFVQQLVIKPPHASQSLQSVQVADPAVAAVAHQPS
jgi:hypothetical protein